MDTEECKIRVEGRTGDLVMNLGTVCIGPPLSQTIPFHPFHDPVSLILGSVIHGRRRLCHIYSDLRLPLPSLP